MANVTTIVGSIQGIKPTEKNLKLNGKLSKFLIGADVIKNKNYKEVEYLVDKLIPRGTLCALVGESDTGKSSLLRQLAVSMVYGDEDFLGFKMKSSCNNVLYVSTEDGEMATSVWLNKYFGQEKSKDDIQSNDIFLLINICLWWNSSCYIFKSISA